MIKSTVEFWVLNQVHRSRGRKSNNSQPCHRTRPDQVRACEQEWCYMLRAIRLYGFGAKCWIGVECMDTPRNCYDLEEHTCGAINYVKSKQEHKTFPCKVQHTFPPQSMLKQQKGGENRREEATDIKIFWSIDLTKQSIDLDDKYIRNDLFRTVQIVLRWYCLLKLSCPSLLSPGYTQTTIYFLAWKKLLSR